MDNLVVLKNKIIALRENNQLDAIDSIMPTALNHTRAAIRVSLMNLTQPKYLEKLSNKELRSLLQDHSNFDRIVSTYESLSGIAESNSLKNSLISLLGNN